MDDVAILERGAGLVSHGVHNAEQARGEGQAGEALGLVHVLAALVVARVGNGQPLGDLTDAVQGVGIGEHGGSGRDVGLEAVRKGIHASVRAELLGHGVGELGVDNGDIGRDVEVGQRVLDAVLVIGDDREGGYLGSGARSGANGAEVGLLTQLGEGERLDDVVELLIGILVEHPHGLCGVDRRAAADSNDPVGAKLLHGLGALLHGLDRRVRLDTLEQLDLEASVLQVLLDILQEAAAAHAVAAGDDDGLLALEVLHLVASALTKVQVTRVGKTSHSTSSNSPVATDGDKCLRRPLGLP